MTLLSEVDDRGRESQMPRVSSPVQQERPMTLDSLSKYPSSYENQQFGPMMRTQPPSDRWTPNDMAMRRIQQMMEQRLRLIEMIERKMKNLDQITTPSVPRSPVGKLFPTVRKFITVKKSFIPARKVLPPQQQNQLPPQISNNTPTQQQPVRPAQRVPQPPQNRPHFIIAQKKQFVQVPQKSSPQYVPAKQSTHIRINVPNVFPQIPQPPSMSQREMPQIPRPQDPRFNHMHMMAPNAMHRHMMQQQPHFPHIPSHPMAHLLQRMREDRVQLPKIPVQVPPVQVQPGPNLGEAVWFSFKMMKYSRKESKFHLIDYLVWF